MPMPDCSLGKFDHRRGLAVIQTSGGRTQCMHTFGSGGWSPIVKHFALILLLVPLKLNAQACTNPGSGNVCAPAFSNTAQVAKTGAGVPTDGSWALLNHAADLDSGDQGCYSSGQVAFAPNAATITMTKGSYQCGASDITTTTQSYLSGSMAWKNLAYAPSQTSSGHVTIEVKAKMGRGWPAIWMLGGNGDTPSSTGCQYPVINQSWNNIDNCNWSSDASDSAEVDIQEEYESNGYTSSSHNKFVNGGSVACSQNISDATQNFHVYHMDWSANAIDMKVDGVDANCGYTSGIPQQPMFLIIENRVNPNGAPSTFPQVMTIQYVQVCDGSTCTAPNSAGGNTLFYDNFGAAAQATTCDLNGDGVVDATDVGIAINQALGISPCTTADLDQNGVCNVVDVQRVINAALGQACKIGP